MPGSRPDRATARTRLSLPRSRLTRACVTGAAIGLVPFLAVLWDFGLRPLRTMTASGQNANFFDLQARALFHGRLHVPRGSLGIEGFVVDGREYMYFGPFPALLRMPVLLVTDRLDGKLTALSMLAGWIVLALALTWMIHLVRERLRGDAEVGGLEAVGVGAVMATVTGGSTMVFLASQPWVYHEVYVWSTALTVATVASLIAGWDDLNVRSVARTFALALATMLTRIPAGWALGLALVATGAWLHFSRRDARPRDARLLMAAGVATLLIGSAVNWAKFRHPFMFPIEDQVWSQLSEHRKLVLLQNDGSIGGVQFLWTTLTAYFRPDGVRFVSLFPFVTPPSRPQGPVGDVFLDETLRTGSITALMPLLLGLAVWGVVVVFRPAAPRQAAAFRLPLVATLAMTVGVIAFGHIAQRYTSEFLPFLALAGSVGVLDVARRLAGRPMRVRRLGVTVLCALAAYGVIANLAIAAANGRQSWRGDRLADFIGVQAAISEVTGDPLDGFTRHVDRLPAEGRADELFVVGDCDALYLATGEDTSAWIPIEFRDRVFRVDVGEDGLRPGSASLMWFAGHTVHRLRVQTSLEGDARLVMVGVPPDTAGRWLDVGPGDTIEVVVHADTARNSFTATASVVGGDDGAPESVVRAPITEWNRQYRTVQVTPAVAVGDASEAAAIGVRLEARDGPRPDLCSDLLP